MDRRGAGAAAGWNTGVRACVQNRQDESKAPAPPAHDTDAASRMPGTDHAKKDTRTMESTIEAGRFGSGRAVHRIEDEALLAGRGRWHGPWVVS